MKNGSLLAVSGLALVLGLGFILPPAAAQSAEAVKVTLPFEATVGTATLPAGDYTIRELDYQGQSAVLEFQSASGHAGVLTLAMRVTTPNTEPSDKTEVVLHRDGSKYVATAIWLKDCDYGYELAPAAPRD